MYFLKKYNVQILIFAEDGFGDIFVIIWINIYFLKKYNIQILTFANDGFGDIFVIIWVNIYFLKEIQCTNFKNCRRWFLWGKNACIL